MKPDSNDTLYRQEILDHTAEPKTPDQLRGLLARQGLHISSRELSALLSAMMDEGLLMRGKNSRYARPEYFSCLLGTFCSTGRSYAFVTPESGGTDIFIPPHRDGGAWNGDLVLIHLLERSARRRSGRTDENRREAEVYRIIQEHRRELTGCVAMRGKLMLFRTDDGKYPEIIIGKNNRNGARAGDRVSVQVTFRGGDKYLPQGVVTKVFGNAATMQSSIAAVLHDNDVPEHFPPEVQTEAQATPTFVRESDLRGRLDLRGTVLFTIDGDTARDFDDAVSLDALPNGHYRLGVHIADVSYYVCPGTALDEEAFKRGTSVYYPGHVVPMLPFELSNGICSLNPDVDRLAFSVFIEMDGEGRRLNSDFRRSVIRSHARLTYNQVNAALNGDEAVRDRLSELLPVLERMNGLAGILHRQRLLRGALELDIPECEILCDEQDHVTAVGPRERGESEHLIEEFMLAANEAVAEHLFRHDMAAVYRVHETPDPQKLREFARQARLFGYRLKESEMDNTRVLQDILKKASEKSEHQILPSLLLRAMARARYSPTNLGHYGLAAPFYLHFTSPIRRYPDLAVHRMLAKLLEGRQSSSDDREFCIQAAVQSSSREEAADTCERQIDKLYQAEYLSHHIGETFSGHISGVTSFGIFVCLDSLIEGMVRLDTLRNDWFEYDPERMTLTGRHTGQQYRLGLPAIVTVVSSSPSSGQIDFIFAEDDTEAF